MTVVVVGVVADSLGGVCQTVTVPYNGPGRNFDVRKQYSSMPSTEYRSLQEGLGGEIRVDINHDPHRLIGSVRYLERNASKLFAVCEIDASTLADGPHYFSPEVRHRGGTDIELRAVAVVKNPATVGLGPLDPYPGDLDAVARTRVFQHGWAGGIIRRANEYDKRRKRGEPHRIHDTNKPATAPKALAPVELASSRPAGRIEYRSAQPLNVNPRHRLIEVLAVPYGVEAQVVIAGRQVSESFSNTAFIGEQPKRIFATRDHDSTRLIGKVENLEPFHKEGLVATIRASDTALGRESVELARDEILDVSIGFMIPTADGEVWESRNRRRVTKAWLREVSLVPEPAYPTRVLDVRSPTRGERWEPSAI